MRVLVLFFFALIIFGSCEKESDSYLIVSPADLAINANSGDVLKFNISGFSVNGIIELRIMLSPKNGLSTDIFDTTFLAAEDNLELYWEYRVPSFKDPYIEAELNFITVDNGGKSVWNTKLLYISTSDYLTELTGFEIHTSMSRFSSVHNAFSFFTNSTVHSDFADSADMHIMDATDSTTTIGDLSLKWTSPANASFVRFNDFDYSKAKLGSVINSFEAGIPSPFVSNIKTKDIILVRYMNLEEKKYAVIKITSVIDEQGYSNDRYIFNIKTEAAIE